MLPLSVFQVEAFCAAAEPRQNSSSSDDPRTEQPWLPLPIEEHHQLNQRLLQEQGAPSSPPTPRWGRTGGEARSQELLRQCAFVRQQLDLKSERETKEMETGRREGGEGEGDDAAELW